MTSPLSGNIFHRQAGTCSDEHVYQIQSPACSRYEDMNGGAKRRNWDSLVQLRVI